MRVFTPGYMPFWLSRLSIRQKVLSLVTTCFLVLLLMLAFYYRWVSLAQLEEREYDNLFHQGVLISNVLDLSTSHLPNVTRDWSSWDIIHEYVQKPSMLVEEETLDDYALKLHRLDFLIVANTEDRVVFTRGVEGDTLTASIDFQNLITGLGPRVRATFQENDSPDLTAVTDIGLNGFAEYGGRIYYFCSYPIIHSDETGPCVGSFTFGREIDAEEMQRLLQGLGPQTSSQLTIMPREQLALDAATFERLSRDKLVIEVAADSDIASTYILMNAIQPEHPVFLRIDDARMIFNSGIQAMQTVGLGVLLILALINVLLYFIFDVIVLEPLNVINRQVALVEKMQVTAIQPGHFNGREFRYLAHKIRRMVEKVYHVAHHDLLTSLPNRTLFASTFEEAMVKAQRNRTKIAIFYLDIDKFKIINDTLSHRAGDLLIQSVAKRLSAVLGTRCLVSRSGGDEFNLIATGLTGAEAVENIARLIQSAFSEPYDVESHVLRISVSIGSSIYPDDALDLETLQKNADEAMYSAKYSGRNCHRPFTPEIHEEIMRYAALERQLREAIDANYVEFEPYFQPMFDPLTHKVVSCEALIRWNAPQGLVGPQQFIPIAEETGLIVPLSRWMLNTACACYTLFLTAGFDLMFSVNVSAQVLLRDEFLVWVEDALQASAMPASRLDIEITETTLASDVERVSEIIARLQQKGISVTIDDFGTGYSSLSYFRQFAVNGLKIDRSFVQGLPHGREEIAIIGATMAMARALDLTVTAEGVENEVQLQWLRNEGCQRIQGYIFSKPLPMPTCIAFLSEKTRRPIGLNAAAKAL